MKKTIQLFILVFVLVPCLALLAACGDHEHTYGDAWKNDSTSHWHEATCEHSDQKGSLSSHSYGEWVEVTASTCTVAGTRKHSCTVCGFEETGTAPLASHSYGNWTETQPATCGEAGSKKRICSVCNGEETQTIDKLPHAFANVLSKDQTGHWYAATCQHSNEKKDFAAHDFGNWQTVTPASCSSLGEKQRTCLTVGCGYIESQQIDFDSNAHSFNTSVLLHDQTGHWYGATCGHDVKQNFAEHIWSNWQITDEADCNNDGEKQRTCACGEVDVEVISKQTMPHTFDKTTWAKDSNGHWYAATCGHTNERDSYSQHHWGLWTIIQEETCSTTGEERRTCNDCGREEFRVREIDPDAHPYSTVQWQKDDDGHWYGTTCVHTEVKMQLWTHDWDSWQEVTPSTCGTHGTQKRECKVCEFEQTADVPLAPHAFDMSKWESDSTGHWRKATCGHDDEKGYFAQHSFGNWEVETPSTCEQEGTEKRVCACGYYETRELPLSDEHSWSEDATSNDTEHWYETTCSHDLKKDVQEHSWNNWHTTQNSTCEVIGVEQRECTVCQRSQTRDLPLSENHTVAYPIEWDKDEQGHWYKRLCSHTEDIVKTAHEFGEWFVVPGSEATCTSTGLQRQGCTICQYYHEQTLPRLEHEYVEGKCKTCQKEQPPAYVRYTYNDVESETGEFIKMGSYPQAEVTDANLKEILLTEAGDLPTSNSWGKWIAFNEYVYGTFTSYMFYQDIYYLEDEYRAVYFTHYRPNDVNKSNTTSNSYQDDNSYDINTVYFFKYEPIMWQILSETETELFVTSFYALDCQMYDQEITYVTDRVTGNKIYPTNYEKSDVRKWLNETFYEQSFASYQKDAISVTTVANDRLSTNMTSGYASDFACADTQDKVFLLSFADLVNASYGFNRTWTKTDSARQLYPTAYSKCMGVQMFNGTTYWLTRSPRTGDTLSGVLSNGSLGEDTTLFANYKTFAIRPSLNVKK